MKTFIFAGILGVPLLLAACGTSTNSTTLAQVQAEAASITAGINAANSLAQASTVLTPGQKALAQASTATVDSAEKVVATLNTTKNFGPGLVSFDEAVASVMPTLDAVWAVNPTTAAAIELGLGLKDAFIAGVTTVPATAVLNHSLKAGINTAPVPVPLPVHQV